jgi:DNA-binding CsgD family transcriptional regulator
MRPAAPQKELFTHPARSSGTVFVNDRVCVETEQGQRVLFVHGIVFSHYSIQDRSAEAYAMVQLSESGYADQNDIARCFGYSARTLRRYQERFKAGGLSALARPRGRPAARSPAHKKLHERDRTILRLKAKEMSNRWIAGRLGLSEKTVRKSLRRLGWKSDPEPDLPSLSKADSQAKQAPVSASKLIETPPSAAEQPPDKMPQPQTGSTAKSFDTNPLDRSMDRLLAAIGLLDDPPGVCSHTKPAKSRCAVSHSSARCQWPALHGRENLRQPRPCFLRTSEPTQFKNRAADHVAHLADGRAWGFYNSARHRRD